MAITKPVPVKGAQIVSSDIVSFDGGLDENGDYNIAPNCISYGLNAMVNLANNVTKRLSRKKWLPNATAFNSEVATVYYNNQIYYFIADNGKIRYIQDNGSAWIACGGSNAITTTAGVITTFLRVNNWLLCLNGVDELRYIDLSTLNMTQFTFVADPTAAITAVATGITASGSFKVYYAYTYNSDGGGETAISPILSQAVSKSRSTWKSDGTEFLTLTFNDTPPAGATSRNLYAAIALQGTTPVASDLALLQANIPTGTASVTDNGSLPFNIAFNTAPSTNSTRGLKASAGAMAGSVPVLYGDPNNPYDLNFGALTTNGVTFGANNGGQRLPLLKGTNFYPTSVIGFRNNQNIPNLIALFSGTDGVSRQQIISQKTLSYGNTTINYWGADDLNTGAGALYSSQGVISYLNQLLFPSSDGVVSIKTDSRILGVLSPTLVSKNIANTYGTIKNAQFNKIVATALNNLIFFAIPSRGYNYNNQIAVYDLNNIDKPKWYLWDLGVDWIGSISPPNQAAFVYIRQGQEFYKLQTSYVAEDENADGTSTAYPVTVNGNLKAFSQGRNVFMAVTQSVFYLANFIGSVDITVSYVDKKGRVKTKTKTFTNGSNSRNIFGGWGNPRLRWYGAGRRAKNWSTPIPLAGDSLASQKTTKRCRIRLPNPVVNEIEFSISSNLANTSFDLVNANFEGVNIGVIGDIV
jgi:hypothetical protein